MNPFNNGWIKIMLASMMLACGPASTYQYVILECNISEFGCIKLYSNEITDYDTCSKKAEELEANKDNSRVEYACLYIRD